MPIHVRFQLAVVRVIRKLARTADRRVITRQSSTGIQFLDDYQQEGRAVGSGRNPDSRAEKKTERKGKKGGDSIAEKTGVEGKKIPVIGETDSFADHWKKAIATVS